MTTSTDNRLELYVFGAAQGESIVIRLPSGDWGVVDCLAASLNDENSHFVLQFLLSRGVKELEFLCLTHPHEDHYLGMSHLLAHFVVKHFWQPAAMTNRKLHFLVMSAIDAIKSGTEDQKRKHEELERIYRLIATRKKEGGLRLKNCSLGNVAYPTPFSSKSAVEIRVIAPSGNDIDKYERDIAKAFDDKGMLKSKIPPSRHNAISIGLLLTYGHTRIVLGGDVEHEAWINTLAEVSHDDLAATCVKVSHHGSTTGYCDGLWAVFSRQAKPIAVLTSFVRHGLPDPIAIAHVRQHVQLVSSTRDILKDRKDEAIPLSVDAPIASRKAIAQTFKARHEPVADSCGVCSLAFDDLGNCTGISHSGGAVTIK